MSTEDSTGIRTGREGFAVTSSWEISLSDDEKEENTIAETVATTCKKPGRNTKAAKATTVTGDSAGTKKSKASKEAKGSSSKDKTNASTPVAVAPSVPVTSGTLTVSNPSHCPEELHSMSTELCAPSQLQAISAQGVDSHYIESFVLPLCTSIPAIIEHMVGYQVQPPALIEHLDFAKKV